MFFSDEEQQNGKKMREFIWRGSQKIFFFLFLLLIFNSSKRGMIEFNVKAEKRREWKKNYFCIFVLILVCFWGLFVCYGWNSRSDDYNLNLQNT
jgi:predicted negative regulator of RcsB-dependent stress response